MGRAKGWRTEQFEVGEYGLLTHLGDDIIVLEQSACACTDLHLASWYLKDGMVAAPNASMVGGPVKVKKNNSILLPVSVMVR